MNNFHYLVQQASSDLSALVSALHRPQAIKLITLNALVGRHILLLSRHDAAAQNSTQLGWLADYVCMKTVKAQLRKSFTQNQLLEITILLLLLLYHCYSERSSSNLETNIVCRPLLQAKVNTHNGCVPVHHKMSIKLSMKSLIFIHSFISKLLDMYGILLTHLYFTSRVNCKVDRALQLII